MGGYFSGGGRNAPKITNFHTIDLTDLKRLGLLDEEGYYRYGWTYDGRKTGQIYFLRAAKKMTLIYSACENGQDWEAIREDVFFDLVPQNFGGHRIWFLCPRCGQRTRALHGGKYFRCRKCVAAVYPSQYETAAQRACTAAQNIRIKLGGSANLTEFFPPKPKGMHQKTYDRLFAKHNRLSGRWIGYLADRLGHREAMKLLQDL